MKFFASFGIGGKGTFESRPNDKFGLAYYFLKYKQPDHRGSASDNETLTGRVWLRGLLQYCPDSVAVVNTEPADNQGRPEGQDKRRSGPPRGCSRELAGKASARPPC